jgi:hypothetical protein
VEVGSYVNTNTTDVFKEPGSNKRSGLLKTVSYSMHISPLYHVISSVIVSLLQICSLRAGSSGSDRPTSKACREKQRRDKLSDRYIRTVVLCDSRFGKERTSR